MAALKLTLGSGARRRRDQRDDSATLTRLDARPRRLPGQVDAQLLIDLPFALPTIVAGLDAPRALRADTAAIGVNVAFTRWGVLLALLFVTLPFVVRTVQPVLIELDREMEEAARIARGEQAPRSSGGSCFPALLPALLSGVALAFARAVGEFGAVVLISGNLPFKTEVASALRASSALNSDAIGGAAVLGRCCS